MADVALIALGALAGGLVSGLTGFGTGIAAMGLWLYALAPPVAGLLTREVGVITLIAFPGTVGGAWAGARLYRRLGDRNYQRIVMIFLLISGFSLIVSRL